MNGESSCKLFVVLVILHKLFVNVIHIAMQWDIAGQERLRGITRAYYRGTAGIFIVYDVQNEVNIMDTFKPSVEVF